MKAFFFKILLLSFYLFKTSSAHAVTYISGQYSIGNYISPSVEEMNKRLGNSPALEVPTQFGRTAGAYLDVLVADRAKKQVWQFGYFGLQESIQSKSDVTQNNVDSTFGVHQLIVGIGTQLWPAQSVGRSGTPTILNPSRFRQSLYVLGFLQTGVSYLQHKYHLTTPSTGTDVNYETSTLGMHLGSTVRASAILYPGLEMHADLGFSVVQPQKNFFKNKFTDRESTRFALHTRKSRPR